MRKFIFSILSLWWLGTVMAQQVVQVEYFINTDPGYGKGALQTVTASADGSWNFNVPVPAGLEPGFHKLFYRVRDNQNAHSLTDYVSIHVVKAITSTVNMAAGEYFIDTDPGYGKGTSFNISPQNSDITQSVTVAIPSGLTPGFHKLFFRTRDALGNWSHTDYSAIDVVDNASVNIVRFEYFFTSKSDPGYGSADFINLTPVSADGEWTVFIPENKLPSNAPPQLMGRVRDSHSKWSHTHDTILIKCDLPAQPGTITGNAAVCNGVLTTYSVEAVTGATSYTWTYSGGGSPVGTGRSITLSPTSAGTLSVIANNDCGSSAARTLAITINAATPQPGTITGSATVCSGVQTTYTVAAVTGATSYTWTYSGGGSPVGTGRSITLSPTGSGTLSVVANGTCGASIARTLAVTVNSAPTLPGAITGNASICNGVQTTYSISAVAGATSYTWAYSGSGNPVGTGTSVTLSPTSGGTLSVVANNTCGTSSPRVLAITVTSTTPQPGVITGNTTVCNGVSTTYSIAAVSGATNYTWTYSGGGNPVGTTTSVTLSPTSSGTLSVVANGTCGTSIARTLAITVTSTMPQPGVITGNAQPCPGSTSTYSIAEVAGATSYQWTLPSGWTGTSTTNSISTVTGTASGYVSVRAVGSCGTSNATTRGVTPIVFEATITVNGNILTASPASGRYQWYTCSGAGQDIISGATNSTYTAPTNGRYAVRVTSDGCSNTSDCVEITTVGVHDQETSNQLIKIYPNPTQQYIRVELTPTMQLPTTYTLYNLTGAIVQSGFLGSYNSQVNFDLPSGTYLMQFSSKNDTYTKKIIITK